ncbi:hypothetical protein M413DRAFT_8790 [Hebeloma cylindrosporum]|uniref:Uncharacterized protein n=1 Tax=Hebeloma cylindrosporum TaxID=76867 RepID=A0A0C2YXK6_HEBCY|nr:hypothetical protein M413DRAFT_8790 [Hebeloma cylindrosporum h7]
MNNNTSLPNNDSQVIIYLPFVLHVPLYTGRAPEMVPSFYSALPYGASTSQITHLSPPLAAPFYPYGASTSQITQLFPSTNTGLHAWGSNRSNNGTPSALTNTGNMTGVMTNEESARMGWTRSLGAPTTSFISSSFEQHLPGQAPTPAAYLPQSTGGSQFGFSPSMDYAYDGVFAGSQGNNWPQMHPPGPSTSMQEMTQPRNGSDFSLDPPNPFPLLYSEQFPEPAPSAQPPRSTGLSRPTFSSSMYDENEWFNDVRPTAGFNNTVEENGWRNMGEHMSAPTTNAQGMNHLQPAIDAGGFEDSGFNGRVLDSFNPILSSVGPHLNMDGQPGEAEVLTRNDDIDEPVLDVVEYSSSDEEGRVNLGDLGVNDEEEDSDDDTDESGSDFAGSPLSWTSTTMKVEDESEDMTEAWG